MSVTRFSLKSAQTNIACCQSKINTHVQHISVSNLGLLQLRFIIRQLLGSWSTVTSDGSRNSQSEDQASLRQTKNVSRLSKALYFEVELKVSTAEMWILIQEMVLKTAMDVYNKFR